MADQNPDPIDVEVGRRIRARRKAMGLSMQTLGDHIGVSYQQCEKYEKGANRVSASMLVRIAQRLETTVGALVGEDGATAPAQDDLSAFLHSSTGLRLADAAKGLPAHAQAALVNVARAMAGGSEARA